MGALPWRVLLPCYALLLALAAGMIWASKPNEQRIKIYSSVAACQAEQPAEDCAKALAAAEQEHTKSAPRYIGSGLCEAEYYGSCAEVHDSTGDRFIPAMAGFMLGHALATGGVASVVSQPVYVDRGGRAYSGASPIGSYRSRCAVKPDDPYCRGGGSGSSGGFVYASGGGGGGSPSSSVWSSKSYTVESVRTSVVRGGFGSSASSAPPSSMGVASAPNATSSSSVARGGFGATAAAHGAGE